MALRRQVYDGVRLIGFEQPSDRVGVADVDVLELVSRHLRKRCERRLAGGIGQLIDNDDIVAPVQEEMSADGRADEASAAGDEYPHVACAPIVRRLGT